jgi:molybdopterin/thiamine biosynthesis adenylyltransferase
MSLALRPRLHHELVAAGDSRTLAQLEHLGVPPGEEPAGAVVTISLPANAGPSRRALAAALLDYTLRLDPLISEVRISGLDAAVAEEIATRLPLEIVEPPATRADLLVAVGASTEADLVLDAGGWVASVGEELSYEEEPVFNPLGPLAAACLGTAEVFKILFARAFPDAKGARRFLPAGGRFSCFDYDEAPGPGLERMRVDAFLLGLGGVGAGAVRVLGELGPHLGGDLALIDHDRLDLTNLNRVTYATLSEAHAGALKVDSAARHLRAACPNLKVIPRADEFDRFKRSLAPKRGERRYDVLITALDDDEVRHAAQRELPRVLVDGSTGRDFNARVERVVFGEWGCLGCTRRGGPAVREDPDGCGNITDPRAPSLSFLAAFPGILAAGELIKEALGGEATLRGEFQHIFYAGPNPDLRSEPARRADCLVGCSDAEWLDAYREKYAA